MRNLFCWITVTAVMFGGWLAAEVPAQAANLDTTADRVFGQPDFTHNTANNGGLSANSLNTPSNVALDSQGNLYVADIVNSRVLEYNAPLSTHEAANRVFGQPDFTHNTLNNGGVSASSLNYPSGVALDAQGDLYVADLFNNRVLDYDNPLTHDTTADRVFGQPDFSHNTANNGGVSASSLHDPEGAALDAQGNLYVTDYLNNRVLEYDNPLTHDTTADRVLGQSDFIHNIANSGGISADSLNGPVGVALDARGNLYVADTFNNRVLEYDDHVAHDTTADRVFGQPDFTHNDPNRGGTPRADTLSQPHGVALDQQNNLYVTDVANRRLLEYDWAFVHLMLPLVLC
jgi:sugar lactone lactonase YvrE